MRQPLQSVHFSWLKHPLHTFALLTEFFKYWRPKAALGSGILASEAAVETVCSCSVKPHAPVKFLAMKSLTVMIRGRPWDIQRVDCSQLLILNMVVYLDASAWKPPKPHVCTDVPGKGLGCWYAVVSPDYIIHNGTIASLFTHVSLLLPLTLPHFVLGLSVFWGRTSPTVLN